MRNKLILAVGLLSFAGIASATAITPCANTTGDLLVTGFECQNANFVYRVTFGFTIIPGSGVSTNTASSATVGFTGLQNVFTELQINAGLNKPFDFPDGGYNLAYAVGLCSSVGANPFAGLDGGLTCSPNSNAAANISSMRIQDIGGTPPVTGQQNGNAFSLSNGAGQTNGTNQNTPVTFSINYTPLAADNGTGTNFTTGFTQDVNQTPEPGTMFLMGGAFLGLGVVARKRRSRS